ncbi:basic phospholipase A2 homolog APC-K49-like [Anomaloglossus baeobatrachus]|uniref:basic phospholipase A2 homolog APC-K49-like n=1 Tax=Anomaloglossus baeobatrachus TaxID=238106 RepID=UPI003F4FA6C6
MVFSWIFPVCLRGTMLSSLLLLLSLVSVEGARSYLSDFRSLMTETMSRRVTDYNFYGCQCGLFTGRQIVDETDRCCLAQFCMYKTITRADCNPALARYYYTYRNGTITCDDDEESGCARQSCEIDRKTVTCLMSHEYSKENAKYQFYGKCRGRRPPCDQP